MKRASGIDIAIWREYDYKVKLHDFIILQASKGKKINKTFGEQYNASNGKLVIGAYHYYQSYYDWKRQADAFLEAIQGKNIMMVALDMEGSQVYKNGFGDNVKRWVEYINENITSIKYLNYMNKSAYQYLIQVGNDWLGDYDLWLAQYPFHRKWDDYLLKAYTGEAHPTLPAGRLKWTFWQFSTDGNGQGYKNGINCKAVGLNVFNGTREEFGKWLRNEDVPFEPPIVINDRYDEGFEDGYRKGEKSGRSIGINECVETLKKL